MSKRIMIIFLISGLVPGISSANGLGESQSWDFRTPSERQILLLSEQTRLNFMAFNREGIGVGGTASGQTGNSLSIVITGDGDNTIDIGQDNTGDQTIQEGSGSAVNTLTADPGAAIANAVERLEILR